MKQTLIVASEVWQQAAARRWLPGLLITLTLALVAVAGLLRLQLVDGILAGATLFGQSLTSSITTSKRALEPVIEASRGVTWVLGNLFGIVAFAEFAPALLSPGRIEVLLALPIKRWQLLLGTYLGVFSIAVVCSLYATSLLSLVIGVKAGVWSSDTLRAGVHASIAFSAGYACMLLSASLKASASLSGAIGAASFVTFLLAGNPSVQAALDRGEERELVQFVALWCPNIWILAVPSQWSSPLQVAQVVAEVLLFNFAVLCVTIFLFERRDI